MKALSLLLFSFASLQAAHAHQADSKWSRLRGADCQIRAGYDGPITSLVVSARGKRANVILYSGPRSPVNPAKGFVASGEGDYEGIVGFPSNRDETLVIKLDEKLGQILGRPQLVLRDKIFQANDEGFNYGFLSSPFGEEEDIELLCAPHFEGVSEDLDELYRELVRPASHPSLCLIQYQDKKGDWIHGCTATAISPKAALSAAHCQEFYKDLPARVKCGSDDWQPISRWEWNPAYRPGSHPVDNGRDISVIVLSQPTTAPAMPVELDFAETKRLILGAACSHYGAGRRHDDSIGTLHRAPYAFPSTLLGGRAGVEKMLAFAGMISSEPSRFMRSGDSGGPILCERDGREVLVGVHSHNDLPGVLSLSALPAKSAEFIAPHLR